MLDNQININAPIRPTKSSAQRSDIYNSIIAVQKDQNQLSVLIKTKGDLIREYVRGNPYSKETKEIFRIILGVSSFSDGELMHAKTILQKGSRSEQCFKEKLFIDMGNIYIDKRINKQFSFLGLSYWPTLVNDTTSDASKFVKDVFSDKTKTTDFANKASGYFLYKTFEINQLALNLNVLQKDNVEAKIQEINKIVDDATKVWRSPGVKDDFAAKKPYGEFCYKVADIYLNLKKKIEDPKVKADLLSKAKDKAQAALVFFNNKHGGAEVLVNKAKDELARLEENKDSSYFGKLIRNSGFNISTKYRETETKSETKYSKKSDTGVVSTGDHVSSSTKTREVTLSGNWSLPFTNWFVGGLGGSVTYDDYRANTKNYGSTWDPNTTPASFVPWDSPKNYDGKEKFSKPFLLEPPSAWSVDLSSKLYVAREDKLLDSFYVNSFSLTPYYQYSSQKQRLAPESDLPGFNKIAQTFGLNVELDLPIVQSKKDLFSWQSSLDMKYIFDTVRRLDVKYSVPDLANPQWLPNGSLSYPAYDKYSSFDQERQMFNLNFGTGLLFNGKNLILGGRYNYARFPNFQNDYNTSPDERVKNLNRNEFMGSIGWKESLNCNGDRINGQVVVNYGFGKQTGSPWGNTQLGLDISLQSELLQSGIKLGVHKDIYSQTTSTVKGLNTKSTTNATGGEWSVYLGISKNVYLGD